MRALPGPNGARMPRREEPETIEAEILPPEKPAKLTPLAFLKTLKELVAEVRRRDVEDAGKGAPPANPVNVNVSNVFSPSVTATGGGRTAEPGRVVLQGERAPARRVFNFIMGLAVIAAVLFLAC